MGTAQTTRSPKDSQETPRFQAEDFEGVRQEVGWIVEQHVAEPPAEHHAQGGPQEKVVEGRRLDRAGRPGGKAPAVAPASDQADDVGQRIPANRHRPERHCDRVDVREGEYQKHERS
jgi:hypothetical protein